MAQKPSLPKGTRDFLPNDVKKRQYIIDIIRKNFESHGFSPIETPSFENFDTLMGKYGEEGDRLIFKILNSGDFLAKANETDLATKNSQKLTSQIVDKALRYDLTVPFARFVVQNQNELAFPFKRYQIQPVWRADRPQKGRYREFYQCDADVVGSTSLWQEIELIQIYDSVFFDLGLHDCTIKMNNRKILSGIAEIMGESDKLIDFTVALDKLDKIGADGVKTEMLEKGISEKAINAITPLFNFTGNFEEKIYQLRQLLANSATGLNGVEELNWIAEKINQLSLKSANLEIDVTLARGLNYYTGAIFEVVAPPQIKLGSIGGGGRYDDLTGIFGLKNMSGVGISFGLDRIFLVLEELKLFPQTVHSNTQILFLNMGDNEALFASIHKNKLIENGFICELYPDKTKLDKQFKYAEKKDIPYVAIAGTNEMDKGIFNIKNLKTGEQASVNANGLSDYFSQQFNA